MYKFLKFILGIILNQFFSEIRYKGAVKQEEGPLLVVINHPNLALDSMLIAKSYKRDLWFLAKSTLFANPLLSKFFDSCHMIPVYRKQDSHDGQINNSDTFAKVVDILCQGKAVGIFPEGVSLGERKIGPLKTGAARIAFQAEEAKNFSMGLKIQAATKLLPKDHPIRQLIEAGLSMVALTIVIQSYKRKNKEIPNLVYKEAKRTFIKLSWLAWNRCKNQPTSKKVIKV